MILAIEHGRTVGRSDATSRHTSGTRGVTSTHVAPHAHAHAAGRARVGKERLGTVGVWGTKQVKGRQLTRPFLVRDAPKPHRVVSAPSTPPPRANKQSRTRPKRRAHSRAAGAPSEAASWGKEKTGGWFTAGSPKSNIWALRTLRKMRRFAFSTPSLTSTSPLTSDG